MLDDQNLRVREVAAEMLGRRGDSRAAGPLARSLEREGRGAVAPAVVSALGSLKSEVAMRALLEALFRPWSQLDEHGRAENLLPGNALLSFTKEQSAWSWHADSEWSNIVHQALVEQDAGLRVQSIVLERLQTSDGRIRALAIEELARWMRSEASSGLDHARDEATGRDELLLKVALEDPEGAVREAAAKTLKWSFSETLIDRLITTLAEGPANQRAAAAAALGEIGGDANPDALRRALDDADIQVRMKAAASLRRLRADAANERVIEVLMSVARSDNDLGLRSQAARLLLEVPGGFEAFSAPIDRAAADSNYMQVVRLADDWLLVVPGDFVPTMMRGFALVELGRLDDAYRDLVIARLASPQWATARAKLAEVLQLLGRTDEALAEAREAVRLEPENSTWAAILENINNSLESSR
jgi:HEAT repeat protein